MTNELNGMSECEEGIEREALPKAPWRKIAVLAVVVAVLLSIFYLSPLRSYLGRLEEIKKYVQSLDSWRAPLVVTFGAAVLVGVGFSRLIICGIAGMALGFWQGLLWAQLGTLLGNYVPYLAARFAGGDWAQRHLSKRERLKHLLHKEGFKSIILARQLPVPGLLVNLACGLFHIRHRHFLIGTLIGQLPEAIPCTLIGAGMLHGDPKKSATIIGLAVACAVVIWLAVRRLLARNGD
jgi:uncharacterized membrane protein YdjX (TVP38/TMEM64 family)